MLRHGFQAFRLLRKPMCKDKWEKQRGGGGGGGGGRNVARRTSASKHLEPG